MRTLHDGFPFCVRFALPRTGPVAKLEPAAARLRCRSQRDRRRTLTLECLEGRTLLSTLPSPTTDVANPVSATGATLNGSVNPEGSSTTAWFEYSTDPSFPLTATTSIGSGFSQPDGVAVDAAGDVFVADTNGNSVDEVLPDGSILAIGSGFSNPTGVAVNAAGDVFLADASANAVNEVLPDGSILPIGSGFSNPTGVAVDAAGDVFVADYNHNAVKEILPNGEIKPIGSGFNLPFGVTVDAAGNIFVADTGHNAVKEVLPSGDIKTIGSGFSSPSSVAVDAASDVFVADTGNDAVKEVLPNGDIKTIRTGLVSPNGVAVDSAGDVFVADSYNNRVVELSPPTVAATPSPLSGSTATAVTASLTGLTPGTTYYSASSPRSRGCRRRHPEPASILTIAPTGRNARLSRSSDGATLQCPVNPRGSTHDVSRYATDRHRCLPDGSILPIGSGFNQPDGVAVDAAGDVFVADTNATPSIRGPARRLPILPIGSGFSHPIGVAVDAAGDVFVADTPHNAVKEVLPSGVSSRPSALVSASQQAWR